MAFEFDLGNLDPAPAPQVLKYENNKGIPNPSYPTGAQTAVPRSPNAPIAGNDTGLDLSILDDIMQELEFDTKVDQNTARQVATQTNAVADSAMSYLTDAREAGAQMDKIEAQRSRAQGLADSNNPFDRIELLGAQILNPVANTKQGRESRMAETNNMLAMRGNIHNVEVTASAARVAQIQAQGAVAKMKGTSAATRLSTKVNALETMRRQVIATEGLRQDSLGKQTEDTLKQTMTMSPDETGHFTIGDYKYTEAEVNERRLGLQDRRLLASVPRTAMNNEALAALQEIEVRTFSYEESLAVRENNYFMDGVTYSPALIDAQMASKGELRMIQEQEMQVKLNNTETMTIERMDEAVKYGEFQAGRHEANTPMGRATANYQTQLDIAMEYGESSKGDSKSRLVQNQMVAQARLELDKAAEAQAKVMAGKDTNLIPILQARITGTKTDEGIVFGYVTENYAKGESFGQAFSTPSDAAALTTMADAEFKKLETEELATMGINGTSFGNEKLDTATRKTLKNQAVGKAWEQFKRSKAGSNVSMATLRGNQSMNNPAVVAGVSMQQAAAFGKQQAIAVAAKNFGLDQDKVLAVLEGEHIAVGVTSEVANQLRSGYNASLVMGEYDYLERQRPGLGKEYTSWLGVNLNTMAKTENKRNGPDADMFLDSTEQQVAQANYLWGEADTSAAQRVVEVGTDQLRKAGAPATVFPSALNLVNGLTGQMKHDVLYKIWQPAIQAAERQGMTANEQMEVGMQALEAGIEGDAATSKAAKTAARAIPQVLEVHESLLYTAERNLIDTLAIGASEFMPSEETIARDRAAIAGYNKGLKPQFEWMRPRVQDGFGSNNSGRPLDLPASEYKR